ncbi:Kinesin- protein 11, partial [Massospora cicadina]
DGRITPNASGRGKDVKSVPKVGFDKRATSPTKKDLKPKAKPLPKKISGAKGCNIQVVVRLRGPNAKEKAAKSLNVVYIPENSTKEIKIINDAYDRREPPIFRFDHAFGPQTTQGELFETVVSPILDEVLMGFNCTIFAYGQTGTGKTYPSVGYDG